LSIESAPSQNAALAIALLSPGLQAVPQVISTLFDLLGDPRSAAGKLSSGDRAELLLLSIESAPSQNAALAIALLSPGLQAVPQVISTLFDLLGDPELGSAAALTLARIDEPLVEAQLVQLAGSEGLAATRARMAISLRETQAMPGTQR
jgi:hypothetical protein